LLLLQLEMCSHLQATFVMTAFGNGLMYSSPQRPEPVMQRIGRRPKTEPSHHMPDFRHAHRQHNPRLCLNILRQLPGVVRPPFASGAICFWRMTERKAWATKDSVMCRYQP